MKLSRAATVAVGALAAAGTAVFAYCTRTRPAHAQANQAVRDFYGEASEEVTAVTAVPDGMVCGKASVGSGLTVQTTEPPGGFTGACLMNRPYGGGPPSVCYSPSPAKYTIQDMGPTAPCTIPAANVVQADWHVNASGPDAGNGARQAVARTRVLETCVPHLGEIDTKCYAKKQEQYFGPTSNFPNGDCPCGTTLVSHSCCTQFGRQLQSDDGVTASGPVYFEMQPQ
jgi:hypothetical protein